MKWFTSNKNQQPDTNTMTQQLFGSSEHIEPQSTISRSYNPDFDGPYGPFGPGPRCIANPDFVDNTGWGSRPPMTRGNQSCEPNTPGCVPDKSGGWSYLNQCAKNLQSCAPLLESKDPNIRADATRCAMTTLHGINGFLRAHGMALIPSGEPTLSRSGACKDLGDFMDRMTKKYGSRGTSFKDLAEMTTDCFPSSRGGFFGDLGEFADRVNKCANSLG